MAYFEFEQKRVFYRIKGKGNPLLLLHGNTVSSKMFSHLVGKYAEYFQVILIDFPGHGRSDRLEKFETDFWYYNAKAVYALIDYLNLEKVSIIGTSGGALVGINLALEHPERINYLIADSFEGEHPLTSYIESLKTDRDRDKKKLLAKLIWLYCHGRDWKNIVDNDTLVNIEFARTGKSFFHKSISELTVPTLITGSRQDEYCDHLDNIYAKLKAQNDTLKIHMFNRGGHPAMLSNKNEFLNLIKPKILAE